MDWFYAHKGRQNGPVSDLQLDELIREGTVTPDTLVWRERLPDWQMLRTAREAIAPALPSGAASAITGPSAICAECHRTFSQNDMVFLNRCWVCAQCKPQFLQRLAEGAAPMGGRGTLWRSGKQLVMRHDTLLPDNCVRCNAPANGYRLKRQLYWHPPLYYLLIFFYLLIYVVVAMIVRKRATIHVGLCNEHRARRTRLILGTSLTAVLGFLLIFVAAGMESGWMGIVSALLLLGAGLFAAITLPVVSAGKIDKEFVRVKKVGEAFLNNLPEWPGPG
jgi:hypothetical protein